MSNNEQELTSLLNKLPAQIESDKKDIETREKRIKDNEELLRVVKRLLGVSSPSLNATGYGNKAETVRKAIEQITKSRFTLQDILEEIRRANPDLMIGEKRVRMVLWQLQKDRELIKQVREGNNRQAPEFEKLTNGAGSQVSGAVKLTAVRP